MAKEHLSKESSLQDIIYHHVTELLQFPNATICKHAVALDLLDTLERCGHTLSDDMVNAIGDADDDSALKMLTERRNTIWTQR